MRAFREGRAGRGVSAGDELYTVAALNGRPRRLGRLRGWNPAWSPDGRRIAFLRAGLWTVRPDGSSPRRLARRALTFCGDSFTAPSCGPVWSRDGRTLYYLAPG